MQILKQFKLRYVHTFLFAVFPVLYLLSVNISELYNTASRFLPLVLFLVLVFAASVFLVVLLFTRKDLSRASIITTLLLFVFFSYGYFFDFLHDTFGNEVIRHRFILPAVVLATFLIVIYLFITRKSFDKIHGFLNIFGTIFLVFSVTTILATSVSSSQSSSLESAYDTPESAFPTQVSSEKKPDIYYIVLDAYANEDILSTFYDYDNSDFINFLRERDFYVADESMSNYGYTQASLSTSLNMNYLDSVVEVYGREKPNFQSLTYLVENNEVIDILKRFGYTYVHFSSGYSMTNFNKHADVSFREGMDRFSLFLLNSTILRPVIDPTSQYRIGLTKNDVLRKRIRYEFDTLQELPNMDDIPHPQFVFTHVVTPHHPYIFDEDGNAVPERPETSLEAYTDQMTFVNKKMKPIIDSILENSDTPPIIIIQSDHGVNPPTEDSQFYRLHNFTAINFGEYSSSTMTEDITSVNTFRTVFNEVFSMQLPILESRSYGTSKKSNLDFTDVTDIILEQRATKFVDKK